MATPARSRSTRASAGKGAAKVAAAEPVQPTRTPRGEARRTRILNSAIRLMWRDGYDGVSIDTILNEAGALKGSFYYYFPSKLDLLLACFEHLWSVQRQQLEALTASAPTGRAALDAHLEWICDAQRTGLRKYGFVPGFFYMPVGTSAVVRDPRLAQQFKDYSEDHRVILRRALERMYEEESLDGSAQLLVDIITNYISGAILRARISNEIGPVQRIPADVEGLLARFQSK